MMSKLVFIATREPTYSRVSLMRRSLHERFEVLDIVSKRTRYPLRLLSVIAQLMWCWLTGRLRRCDGVVVGFFAQPIFPLVRLLYRGPIVADAYFSMFDTVVHDKQTASARSLQGRLCRWLDRYMLKHAELCLTDTQAHVEYFRSEFELPNAPMKRLWISAEGCERLPIRNRLNDERPLEVFFWGGFIPLQGVETIVEAAALLRNDNIRFTIYGAGQTFASCQQLATDLNVPNIHFAGWKSFAEVKAQAANSDLALGIFGDTAKAARVIPNKAYEALAMGIPLITRESPAIAELLSDSNNVLLVPAANSVALAEKIRWMRDNYSEAIRIANNGHETFCAHVAPDAVGQLLGNEVDDTLRMFRERTVESRSHSGRQLSPSATR